MADSTSARAAGPCAPPRQPRRRWRRDRGSLSALPSPWFAWNLWGRDRPVSSRDRDCPRAYPLPSKMLGSRLEKRHGSSPHDAFGLVGNGAIVADLRGGRVAPIEK